MRIRPHQHVTCRVCGAAYTVHYADRRAKVAAGPAECPACKAPYKAVPNREVALGRARTLLLALSNSHYFRHLYGPASDYLIARSRDEPDVEYLVSLAGHMDYDAWQQQKIEGVESDRRPSLGERESLKWIPLLGAEARSGALLSKLRDARSAAFEALRAERAKHLAIYEARRSK